MNGPAHVEIVQSPKGLFDYFIHAENKEKTQYDINDIEVGCGFNLDKFLVENNSDDFMHEVVDIIEQNDFTEFEELVWYARANHTRATHAAELRQTLLLPPRPVAPATQCADRVACVRPRPGRIDPRQIAISPALVRDHSGRPRAYGVTGTLCLNGGTDGHQGQQADGKRGLSGRGLVHECQRVRNEWKWTERIERRGLASCTQVAESAGRGLRSMSVI